MVFSSCSQYRVWFKEVFYEYVTLYNVSVHFQGPNFDYAFKNEPKTKVLSTMVCNC